MCGSCLRNDRWVISSAGSTSAGSPVPRPLSPTVSTLGSGTTLVSGLYTSAGDMTANHIARWDGSAWSVVSSPNVGASTNPNQLYGVTAVSANDVSRARS